MCATFRYLVRTNVVIIVIVTIVIFIFQRQVFS